MVGNSESKAKLNSEERERAIECVRGGSEAVFILKDNVVY